MPGSYGRIIYANVRAALSAAVDDGCLSRNPVFARSVKPAVSEYLGHSNAALTLRIYAHLMPSSQERTRTAIATVYAKAQRPL